MMPRRNLLAQMTAAAVTTGLPKRASAAPAPKRIAYGTHASQWGELYVPDGAAKDDKLPAIVIVHGGFWRQRYGADLGRPLALDLATNHRVAAWNIEYRRVGGDGGYPATLEDIAAAVDALAAPVQEIAGVTLDLTRVAAIGHSAGGHLAGWLASRQRLPAKAPGANPRVMLAAAVSQAGVLDLADGSAAGLGAGAVDAFMGGKPEAVPERYAIASPIALLPTDIPLVCVHGEDDDTVPIRQSERYVAAAKAAGDHAALLRFENTGHFEVIDPRHPSWRVCKDVTLDILG